MNHTEAARVFIVTDGEMFRCFGGAWTYNPRNAESWPDFESAESVAKLARQQLEDDNVSVTTLAKVLR